MKSQRKLPIRIPIKDPMQTFQRFFKAESASGIILILCTLVALIWSNSPWSEAYGLLNAHTLDLHLGSLVLPHSPAHWVNDGLMALFFLLVGLEIKREIQDGELSNPRNAALPIAAALGGMIVPALLYAGFNHGGPGKAGWGIPMATDIAFALGVLSLLGNRVPLGLRVFLAALAIIDDLGAVLVIAFFYTSEVSGPALGVSAALMLSLMALARMGVRRLLPYLVLGGFLWLAILQSGVHATVAGVLLAFAIPHPAREAGSPLLRLEHALQPWVSFLILPVFAIVNAGVRIDPAALAGLSEPIALGVETGLVLGKPVGILLFTWLAVAFRLGAMPGGVGWPDMAGCAMLGGIGFTMSIFIAGLALGPTPQLEQAKLAILAGSTVSGVAGWLALRVLAGKTPGRRPRPG